MVDLVTAAVEDEEEHGTSTAITSAAVKAVGTRGFAWIQTNLEAAIPKMDAVQAKG